MLVFQAVKESPTPVKFHLARDGEQAVLMFGDRTFDLDLVILDLNLPGLSGFGVLELWMPTPVPVVVFSGSSDDSDRQLALELGACEFVQKPADFQAFQDAVQGLIARWRRARAVPV
jgi:DNA-binding response OmpR family regulator